jgi:hypothetical protein
MEDYHVISMDTITSEAKDNGVASHAKDAECNERQM